MPALVNRRGVLVTVSDETAKRLIADGGWKLREPDPVTAEAAEVKPPRRPARKTKRN